MDYHDKKEKILKLIKKEIETEFLDQFIKDVIQEFEDNTQCVSVDDLEISCIDCATYLPFVYFDNNQIGVDISDCTCRQGD
jgi:hypothetical protein